MHGEGPHAEGQADLPLHVPTQERLHLLRKRPPAGAIPAGDRDHEGLRRRLEGRRRHRAGVPDSIPSPITPPPQPTGRTANPSACLFYSDFRGIGTSLRTAIPAALTNVPTPARRDLTPCSGREADCPAGPDPLRGWHSPGDREGAPLGAGAWE